MSKLCTPYVSAGRQERLFLHSAIGRVITCLVSYISLLIPYRRIYSTVIYLHARLQFDSRFQRCSKLISYQPGVTMTPHFVLSVGKAAHRSCSLWSNSFFTSCYIPPASCTKSFWRRFLRQLWWCQCQGVPFLKGRQPGGMKSGHFPRKAGTLNSLQ
jgi:hypothetical protein